MGEKMTLTLLSSYLDDGGWHTEAENVRNGVDLKSYENEIRLIAWLNRHLTQPAQAVDEMPMEFNESREAYCYRKGWNACRQQFLTAAIPQPNDTEGAL